ncbi:MAG: hypothetical protein LBC56_08530 [Oscillospiraceae bacterium]|nr:hypothetical protein [Oscillospiraceae bacterium]
MIYFEELKQGLAESLRVFLSGENIEVKEEFTSARQSVPLRRPLVCVGYESIKSLSGGSYSGESEAGEIFTKNLLLYVALDIYTPVKSEGVKCHSIFSRIADFFVLRADEYKAGEIRAGALAFDSALEAFHMKAEIQLNASLNLIKNQDGEAFEIYKIIRGEVK